MERLYNLAKIRTNLPLSWYGLSASTNNLNTANFTNGVASTDMEVFLSSPAVSGSYMPHGSVSAICYNSQRLKSVVNPVNWAGYTATAFGLCYSLKDIEIRGLNATMSFSVCSQLTPASVAYMINNAGTATFTITLHATAYTAAMADSSVTTALSNHTNVTLASA